MKCDDVTVKEYVKRLSDRDLQDLHVRYKQQLCGDRSTIANQLSKNSEMDQLLANAPSADAWFDMIDDVGRLVTAEYSGRFGSEEGRKSRG